MKGFIVYNITNLYPFAECMIRCYASVLYLPANKWLFFLDSHEIQMDVFRLGLLFHYLCEWFFYKTMCVYLPVTRLAP